MGASHCSPLTMPVWVVSPTSYQCEQMPISPRPAWEWHLAALSHGPWCQTSSGPTPVLSAALWEVHVPESEPGTKRANTVTRQRVGGGMGARLVSG